MTGWVFSGWLQIFNFPPKIEEAEAGHISPGDYMIRRNNAETTLITTSATDIAWDTQVAVNGTSITFSAGAFTLAAGKYLVAWGERVDSDDTTNNARKEVQARLVVGGVETHTGAGSGYIRQQNSNQETFPSGIGILNIASDSTSLVTRLQRGDGGSAGNVNRVAGYGGISILALDDTDLFARYSLNASQAIGNEPNSLNVVWDVNDEQDTGFSRTNDAITIPATAGRYFVSYSAHASIGTSTARTQFTARLSVGGTNRAGTHTSAVCRGRGAPELIQDCILQWGGLVDLSASDVLRLNVTHDDGGTNTADLLSGTTIEIWQLPAGSETIIVRATTGEMAPATQADFAWDTVPQIDAAAFTHTAGNTNIDVDIADDYFFFASQFANLTGGTRVLQWRRLTVQNTLQTHVVGGSYNRGTQQSVQGGYAIGALLTGLSANDSVELANLSVGQTATVNNTEGSFTAFRLGSVFAAPAAQTLTFSISDNAIGFGTLSDTAARFANGAETGSATDVVAHTLTANTNAANGYTITVDGSTLTSGANTIDAMATETTSSTGTEQLGLYMTAAGGNGVVDAVYDNSPANTFALVTASFPDQVASDPDGDDVSTTYSVHYLANIATITEAGSYTATLTYIATGNF